MNNSKEKQEHILSLKVMRLTRPTLCSPIVVSNDPLDLPGELLNLELRSDPAADPDVPTLTAGQMMLIPQSFGNIYLGETFSSYMFTHNDNTETAKMVSVRADLQTSSERISLSCIDPEKCKELAPGATIDIVISHEVKEVGTHILICEVSYLNPADATKRVSFRKFYKFHVLKPLDVKTKIYNAESDEVFLEAQVQNLTSGPINLEKVLLESPPFFKVKCLNTTEDRLAGSGVLHSLASRQYLYCLSPTQVCPPVPSTNVGILDIVWRSNLGERGRLQTSQLQRTAPEYPEIRLSVTQLPNVVTLEEPFTFSCKVSNLSSRTIELVLVLERVQTDMAWVGISGKPIGALEAGGSTTLQLTMVPLCRGLRHISGVRLRDNFLKRTYDYDDLAQVFVT